MNTLPDYYQILGVRHEAGPEELARAYRQQAMRCHPDHGGSHEAMLRLNEAWEILRDPVSRRAYDEWLTQQGVQSSAISTAVQRARTTADQYPRRWVDFEKWMNGILDDFTKAEYGEVHYAGPINFPTAKNSISGTLLIIFGGIAGFIVGTMLGMAAKEAGIRLPGLLFAMGCAMIGAFVGAGIHQAIGFGIKAVRQPSTPRMAPRQPPPRSSSPPPIPISDPVPARKVKISCPHCAQHIEAPADVIGTVVTCPTCNKDFHVGKRAPQPPPIPSQPLQPPPIP